MKLFRLKSNRPSVRVTALLATGLFASTLATGCGGRSTVRLSEIEVTNSNNGDVVVTTIEYNDDGTVDEYERKTNGAFDQRFEASYDRGVFETITLIDDNDNPVDYEFTWDGPLLTRTETDNNFYTARYNYDNDAASSLEEIERTYQYFDSTALNTVKEFNRNDEGIISSTKETQTFSIPIFGDTVTVIENDFDWSEGLIAGVERSTKSGNNTDIDDFDFDYDDQGLFIGNLLNKVQVGGQEYSIQYDDQGRIEEIEFENSNGTITTTKYTYEDGNSNLIWEPAIPFATSFDLTGKPYGIVELMSPTVLFGDF